MSEPPYGDGHIGWSFPPSPIPQKPYLLSDEVTAWVTCILAGVGLLALVLFVICIIGQ